MSSIAEKYTGRHKTDDYLETCLAKFTSEYCIAPKSEKSHVKLDNDLGYVKKRTHTDFAVVRYARISTSKNPEKYYHTVLQLFFHCIVCSDSIPFILHSFEDF